MPLREDYALLDVLVIASCLPVLVLIRDRRSVAFFSALAGTVCFVAMLLSTCSATCHQQSGARDAPETDFEEFLRLRKR